MSDWGLTVPLTLLVIVIQVVISKRLPSELCVCVHVSAASLHATRRPPPTARRLPPAIACPSAT